MQRYSPGLAYPVVDQPNGPQRGVRRRYGRGRHPRDHVTMLSGSRNLCYALGPNRQVRSRCVHFYFWNTLRSPNTDGASVKGSRLQKTLSARRVRMVTTLVLTPILSFLYGNSFVSICLRLVLLSHCTIERFSFGFPQPFCLQLSLIEGLQFTFTFARMFARMPHSSTMPRIREAAC